MLLILSRWHTNVITFYIFYIGLVLAYASFCWLQVIGIGGLYNYSFIHSFGTEIYIALLLRSAPGPCTAKEKSFDFLRLE